MHRIELAALAARLPERPLTRFAPSPTGYLHLGHAGNAVWVWGLARALGGRVLLRLEDHDRGRCRPVYESALLDDLDWLGLAPDIGGTSELRAGPSPLRQSDAGATYRTALDALGAAGRTFVCECSRRDLARAAGDVFNEETRYDGRCRDRGLEPGPGRGVRIRLDTGVERFEDARLGPLAQEPAAQCGDLLAQDRAGRWTYQFAVAVDDLRQGVDLVIRGEDLLPSTGRQIRLARMLGRSTPPAFLHHPLIRHPTGAKLSKANRDTGIRDLRKAGVSAPRVLGLAAHLLGLDKEAGEMNPGGLAKIFEDSGSAKAFTTKDTEG
jgi:glutamyl-tRNA synthetase/glutamyl-Q tRNA(Asp) synthetase